MRETPTNNTIEIEMKLGQESQKNNSLPIERKMGEQIQAIILSLSLSLTNICKFNSLDRHG